MGGFLGLYDETDRVDFGGGYYADIKRYLSQADTARAQRVLVSPRIESTVDGGSDGQVRAVTTTIDQQAYDLEVMVAALVGWNLTDRDGNALPLPPYLPAKVAGDDPANRVRRESVAQLPAFAAKLILKQISDNEKRGAGDTAAFPSGSEGAPTTA